MQEFQVKVTADLGDSKQKIASLQKDIDVLTGQQSVKIAIDPKGLNLDILKDVSNTLTTIGKTNPFTFEFKQGARIATTFSTIKQHSQTTKDVILQTYKITREMDGPVRKWDMGIRRIGRSAASVAKVTSTIWNNKDVDGMLGGAFKGAAAGAGVLVGEVAKIGFALYGLNEVIGVLRAAWGSFFRETIGREVKLRDTILRTRASLASTNKVIVNGQEITDPYEKILKLAGPVEQAINSITERSIELAGVTSGEVINMFNMVAANIGKVGGTLKDAEDLAFAFAAGMGTLGMPGYMAPQEINSILGGYIDRNSRLAQALQISNEDIQKARGEEGGVVEFLKKRLEAVVAGQKIAAQGFTGVVSNIKDLYELTTGNFGAGLLDPLIAGLTVVFEKLNGIRDQIFKIAKGFGTAISSTAAVAFGMFNRGRSIELDPSVNVFDNRGTTLESIKKQAGGEQYRRETLDYFDSLGASIRSSIQNAFVELGKAFAKFQPTLLILTDALRSLVQSFASIKVGTFNALVSALAAAAEVISRLTPSIAMLVNMWARLLNTPVVRYFYEVTTTLKVLKAAGGDILIQGYLIIRFITSALGPAIAKLVQGGLTLIGVIQAINTSLASFAGSIGGAISGLGSALGALLPASNKGPQQIKDAGQNIAALGANLEKTNKKLDVAKGKLSGLGSSLKMLGIGTALFMGKLLLVQLAISAVVDAIGKYQKAQEDKKSLKEAERALGSLQRNYDGLTRSLTAAEQADKSFKESLVNTEYDKAITKIRELKSEINDLTYEMNNPGIQTFGELLRSGFANKTIFGNRNEADLNRLTQREIDRRNAQIKARQPFIDAINRDRDLKQAREDVRVTGETRKNIEKEIGDLRRQIENDIFAKRQEIARTELEIFRAQEELRIRALDRANRKMIQNEEGIEKRGLEAINNYFQAREKGESEIEAARQEAQIEAAAVEKEIIDYRIDMEKKILDIRNRAGINEVKAAEAAARARTAESPTGGGGAFDTGLRTGPSGVIGGSAAYHQDLSFGAGVDLRTQRELVMALARKYDQLGKEMVLSNNGVHGRKFPLSGTAQEQNDWITSARAAHRARNGGSGRDAIDFYTPDKGQSIFGKTVENQAMYAPVITGGTVEYGRGGGAGAFIVGKKDGKEIFRLMHGRTDRALPANRSMPAAPAPYAPQFTPADLPGSSELPEAPAIAARQEGMLRRLQASRDKLRSVRAQIAQANTLDALEAVGRATFDVRELQPITNENKRLVKQLELVRDTSNEAFDPEKLEIISAAITDIEIAYEAFKNLRDKLPKVKGYTPESGAAVLKELKAALDTSVKSIKEQALGQEGVLNTRREVDLALSVKQVLKELPFITQQQQLQNGFGLAQAYDPTNTERTRLLDAELVVLQKRLDLEQKYGPLSEANQQALADELRARQNSAVELAKFDEELKLIATQLELARGAAQAVTNGHKSLAQDILSGGNPSEAMTNALSGMANNLTGMFLEHAFKPMEEQLFRQFREIFKIQDPAEAARKQAEAANLPLIRSQDMLKTSVDNLTTAIKGVSGAATGQVANGSVSAIAPAETAYGQALQQATDAKIDEANKTKETQAKQFDFGKAISGATQAFAGIAMGVAGAQQMSKGGTYNTLMGIAGVLGGLASITGMFGTGGIFAGKPPGNAAGGPVSASRPYIVGEAGPELFVPQTDGSIVTHARTRALSDSRRALKSDPRARANSTPPELARPLDVRFESQVINNVEYVTADQHRKGMAQAAERGRSLALSTLQNSVRDRRRVGMA